MTHPIKTCCDMDWNLEIHLRCLKCGEVLRDKPCDCPKCTNIRKDVLTKMREREESKYEYF